MRSKMRSILFTLASVVMFPVYALGFVYVLFETAFGLGRQRALRNLFDFSDQLMKDWERADMAKRMAHLKEEKK